MVVNKKIRGKKTIADAEKVLNNSILVAEEAISLWGLDEAYFDIIKRSKKALQILQDIKSSLEQSKE